LLLKSHAQRKQVPLPIVAYGIVGGWLGFSYPLQWMMPWVDQLARHPALTLVAPLLPVAAGFACMACTAILMMLLSFVVNPALAWFFRVFNRGFARFTNGYVWSVGWLLRGSLIVLTVYVGLLALTYLGFISTPTGFIPQQDKGYLLVNLQLPDS